MGCHAITERYEHYGLQIYSSFYPSLLSSRTSLYKNLNLSRLPESILQTRLRDFSHLVFGQAEPERLLRQEQCIFSEQGVAEGEDVVSLESIEYERVRELDET